MKKLLILLWFIPALTGATNYYVKNGGSDGASGLDDTNAWATVAKVTATVFSPGDTIFFKKGDTWRLTTEYDYLRLRSGNSGADVVYTSYGTGAKPLILGSKEENSTGDWIDQGSNIWRNSDALFTLEVGNIILNGNSTAKRELTLGNVNIQGDFFYSYAGDYVDFYSVGNPATFYTDIECAMKQNPGMVYGYGSYSTIDGFDIRYGGRHGIVTVSASYITIRNCDISYIGGVETSQGSGVMLGNCIELYLGNTDIEIEKNYIFGGFDAGITSQGGSNTYNVTNLDIHHNLILDCEYGFEFWHYSLVGTVSYVYFQNNTVVRSGYGWSHNIRTTTAHGSSVAMYTFDATKENIYIRNNIFYGATEDVIFSSGTAYLNITFDYNLYYPDGGNYGEKSGVDYATMAAWRTAISQEANSVDGDPLFTTEFTDLTLQVGSPAIGEALGAGYIYDYAGNLMNEPPDIGAYAYDASGPPAPPDLPEVTTVAYSGLWSKGVTSGGSGITDGGGTVSAKGVCYSTLANPTTSSSKVSGGTDTGDFSVKIFGLTRSTTYHLRAYVTNETGTTYGADIQIDTPASSVVTSGGKSVFTDKIIMK